jgi:hypothetical protein
MDTLETLNTKIEKHDNMIRKITQVFDQNNTGYKQNFDILETSFQKLSI